MTAPMVERVARALSMADGNHPEACSNDEEETPSWTLYVNDARAAIAAMREPTDEMLQAAYYEDWEHTKHCYQAAITAALEGEGGE